MKTQKIIITCLMLMMCVGMSATSHIAHFSINGVVDPSNDQTVGEGEQICFPEDPADTNGKKFVGWYISSYSNETTAPTYVSKNNTMMGTSDITFYAVFATVDGDSSTQTITWNINGVKKTASGGIDVNTQLTTSSVDPISETGIWTAVAKSSYAQTNNSKAQLGSSSYEFAGTITLSSTTIPSNATITQINLTATSNATEKNPYMISAKVNGKAYYVRQNLSERNPNCQWVGTATGNSIVLTTSCGYSKNIVISALSVKYNMATYSNYSTSVSSNGSLTLAAQSGSTYYATFSSISPVEFTDNATKVYTANVNNEGRLVLNEVLNKMVPANTGVLIESKTNSTQFTYLNTNPSALDNNLLKDANKAMSGDYFFYKLAYDNYSEKTGLGFYWGGVNGGAFTAKAGGAYLAVPNTTNPVKGYTFEDAEDAIQQVKADKKQEVFNLQGQSIVTKYTTKKIKNDIYIINGKKVLIK